MRFVALIMYNNFFVLVYEWNFLLEFNHSHCVWLIQKLYQAVF